jgi:hypothetical protein
MDPFSKRSEKKAKKASSGGGRSSGRGEKQAPTLPADILAARWDGEELVTGIVIYYDPFTGVYHFFTS